LGRERFPGALPRAVTYHPFRVKISENDFLPIPYWKRINTSDHVELRTVLTLTYHFPPSSASGSFRLLGFARHLPSHGWRAAVVAPPGLPWEPTDPGLLAQVPPETVVYSAPYLTSRVARKFAKYKGWFPRALRAAEKAIREQKPEAIFTSGPPHQIHWLGLWLKRRHGLPWVADFRDPWYSEARLERGKTFESRWISSQESLVMRHADAVIANAPGACKQLCDAYPQHRSKFVTLPNGYDREKFEGLAAEVEPRQPGAPLRLVHAGAIYVGRDPLPVLDAVKRVSEGAEPVALDVRFFGPPPENGMDLGREIEARGLCDRVKLHGQVSYAKALREMASADVLLLMDSPGRTVGVPAKLYEYIGAGRPILALGEQGGDLALVLEQSGLPYRIAPPGDASAIATALVELLKASTDQSDRPARDGHKFSREAIAGQLADLLNRCARIREGEPPGEPNSEARREPRPPELRTEEHDAPVLIVEC